MATEEDIRSVLEDLAMSHSSIKATMVAKRGMEGVMTFPDTFKDDVCGIWEPLSKSVNDMLIMVEKHGSSGLRMAYLELFGYGILFDVFEGSDTALLAFMKDDKPVLNACDVLSKMEKATERIISIITR